MLVLGKTHSCVSLRARMFKVKHLVRKTAENSQHAVGKESLLNKLIAHPLRFVALSGLLIQSYLFIPPPLHEYMGWRLTRNME